MHAVVCCWVILQLLILAHLINACRIRSPLHHGSPSNRCASENVNWLAEAIVTTGKFQGASRMISRALQPSEEANAVLLTTLLVLAADSPGRQTAGVAGTVCIE